MSITFSRQQDLSYRVFAEIDGQRQFIGTVQKFTCAGAKGGIETWWRTAEKDGKFLYNTVSRQAGGNHLLFHAEKAAKATREAEGVASVDTLESGGHDAEKPLFDHPIVGRPTREDYGRQMKADMQAILTGKPAWAAPVVEQGDVKTFLRVDAEDDAETQAAAFSGDQVADQLWHEKSVIRGIEKPVIVAIADRVIAAKVGTRSVAVAVMPRPEAVDYNISIYRAGKMVAIARSEDEARRVLAEEARIALRVERGLDPR